jgi:leucine dehydrogenase
MFDDLVSRWDGEEVLVRHDAPTRTWMFIGIHSTVLGPAMGGTRMRSYASPRAGLEDVLRLSSAMTVKQAAADLPYGGGKAVLAVPEIPLPNSPERRAVLSSYARLVDTLHGTYVTAADMNTGQADMDLLYESTPHVLGRSPELGGSGDPSGGTALGVFHAVRATCRQVFGTADLEGRTVLIQGVGAVGGRLADHLHEAEATLKVSDTVADRAEEVARRTGASLVDEGEVIGTTCDVFAPCAMGAVLSSETIPALRCSTIAGAANNQLATQGDAERLAEAGILYAPDFIANAGGVIWLAGYETLGWDDATMQARLAGIGETLEAVFEAARRDGITTAAVAERLAAQRLAAAALPR